MPSCAVKNLTTGLCKELVVVSAPFHWTHRGSWEVQFVRGGRHGRHARAHLMASWGRGRQRTQTSGCDENLRPGPIGAKFRLLHPRKVLYVGQVGRVQRRRHLSDHTENRRPGPSSSSPDHTAAPILRKKVDGIYSE
jgi:hypothetical protein